MSDATIPPAPRSSSVALPAEVGERSDSSCGDAELDVLISSETKEEGHAELEGKMDNKQKRKRTSPADQAILEAEYKQNPKPNKAARAEIVKKVSLNEKEVQIWFQNRRQINRRKSRPLLPHEIAAFGLGGMAALSSDPATMMALSSSSPSTREVVSSSQQELPSTQDDPASSQDEAEILEVVPAEDPAVEVAKVTTALMADQEVPSLPPQLKRQGSSGLSFSSSFSSTEDVVKSFYSNPGYLANRWNSINSSFSTPSSSQKATFTTPPITQAEQPKSCPERIDPQVSAPASHVRMSMSLDGKAELVSTQPSPPRKEAPRPTSSSESSFMPLKRMRGLQRSQSAFVPRPSLHQSNVPFVPRLPTGRSRDARSWEFCCDSEARDELTLQAENESHGSAVAAISLIRSTSSAALKTNTNKRNTQANKTIDGTKQAKKTKLSRAMSSLARLQNPTSTSSKDLELPPIYSNKGDQSPSGDSDKENWVPGDFNGNPRRRRPLPSSREKIPGPRAILGDNHKVVSQAVNFGGPINKHRKRKSADITPDVFEDDENAPPSKRAPEDVEKFMRGEISPSKKGDLDCVQGLLSLSQGNWR